ncbi:MAG TPA: hypothetical protein VHL10_02980 [Nitrososphaera sp.]|jgi:hypothetical protein|nr:hypothetical protein [Nitrososphaera sp.]
MDNREEYYVPTPLDETFERLKELADETKLLHPMDVEALKKLATLNLLQRMSDGMHDQHAPEQKEIREPFHRLHTWLHEVNKYFIYRDYQSGSIWRLGTFLSRKGGAGC